MSEAEEPAKENNLMTIIIRIQFKRAAKFLAKHSTPTLSALSLVFAGSGYALGKSATPANQSPGLASISHSGIVPQVSFDPSENTVVQHCDTVSGTASLPTGDEVWVIVHLPNPSLYYIEGAATVTSSESDGGVDWNFDNLVVGEASEPGAKYQLVAIVLPKDTAMYLSGLVITEAAGATVTAIADSAAAPQLPPDFKAEDILNVTRDSSPDNCPN